MRVYLFGSEELEFDSVPLKILPALKEEFPEIHFEAKDPNEEWDLSGKQELIIIDTVEGIDKITVFNDLKSFSAAPRITMHDFDAFANMRLLEKLGRLPKLKIIGVPMSISEQEARAAVKSTLREIIN